MGTERQITESFRQTQSDVINVHYFSINKLRWITILQKNMRKVKVCKNYKKCHLEMAKRVSLLQKLFFFLIQITINMISPYMKTARRLPVRSALGNLLYRELWSNTRN